MNTKEVARKVSSFFKPKKAAVKAAAEEPAAAEDDMSPLWTEDMIFNTDGSGDGAFCIHPDTGGNDRKFETKIDNNSGNEPPTDPAVNEDDNWAEVANEEEESEEESQQSDDAAQPGATIVKLNAALKKTRAEVSQLKTELATAQKEKKALEDEKKKNAGKAAAPATTVVSENDKQDDDKPTRELTPSEKEADAYIKASNTNLFK